MSGSAFPSPQHERLDVLAGVWRTRIAMLDETEAEIEHFAATDTYRWMPGRHFLLHDVDAMMAGEPVKSLEIIAADRVSGQYTTRNYDNSGVISDYAAALDGRNWSIDGESERFRGSLSEDMRTLSGRWERRAGDTWLAWMNVTLTRQSETVKS